MQTVVTIMTSGSTMANQRRQPDSLSVDSSKVILRSVIRSRRTLVWTSPVYPTRSTYPNQREQVDASRDSKLEFRLYTGRLHRETRHIGHTLSGMNSDLWVTVIGTWSWALVWAGEMSTWGENRKRVRRGEVRGVMADGSEVV